MFTDQSRNDIMIQEKLLSEENIAKNDVSQSFKTRSGRTVRPPVRFRLDCFI